MKLQASQADLQAFSEIHRARSVIGNYTVSDAVEVIADLAPLTPALPC